MNMINSRTIATPLVVLVTGASRGLGREAALQLAAKGCRLWLGVRDLAGSQPLVDEVRKRGGQAELLQLDITKPEDIRSAFEKIAALDGRLDVLVNNAGVMLDGGWLGNTSLTVSGATLQQTFDTNFFGTVALTQALWPLLERASSANVVNVSSRMGSNAIHADPDGPLKGAKPFAYDASKAALNAFTTHLAELGRDANIQVNSAYPGWVRTELGSDYADLSVEEGARTLVELALLPAGSRTGRFEFLGEDVPW
jgi:NAD(P)-dependent dehydrogenase (short-subunit alcohol dehydrogenase family)